ncbi:MAG: cyclic nucleotide-binding domain-containing protein [Magnetococcales bacterium]|nr:cyclic nucleotide-binding domain-containing protein [Magnetococcales bacterium]
MVDVQKLRQINLFIDLTDDELQAISEFCTIKEFADGEVILYDVGEEIVRDLFLLIDGALRVRKRVSKIRPWKRIDIKAIDNEVFGEVGWLLGTAPSAEVSSDGESQMLVVDGKKLFSLCEKNNSIGNHIHYRIAAILALRVTYHTTLLNE